VSTKTQVKKIVLDLDKFNFTNAELTVLDHWGSVGQMSQMALVIVLTGKEHYMYKMLEDQMNMTEVIVDFEAFRTKLYALLNDAFNIEGQSKLLLDLLIEWHKQSEALEAKDAKS